MLSSGILRCTRSGEVILQLLMHVHYRYEFIGNLLMPIFPDIPLEVYQASYWPQYHISAINPIIYAVSIERFRYHYKIFFSYIFPCCVRHPASQKKSRVSPTSNGRVHDMSHTASWRCSPNFSAALSRNLFFRSMIALRNLLSTSMQSKATHQILRWRPA